MLAHARTGATMAVLALAWALVPSTTPAEAATFTVTVTTDSADGSCDTHCSLREAISAANAAPGPDEIVVQAGTHVLSVGPAGEDLNAGGDLDVLDAVTILGDGPVTTVIDAAGLDRGIEVHPSVDATMTGLTVRGGSTTPDGGGIRVVGTATLRRVEVAGNTAMAGGGIAVDGAAASLTATDVTIRDNTASMGGGGINLFNGQATLNAVTVSGNTSATVGGGILSEGATAALTNVTISGNSANDDGGGLRTIGGGSSVLNNVTVTGNVADADTAPGPFGADDGGGIVARDAGTIDVRNSIVAGNTDRTGQAPDCASTAVGPSAPGILTSGGHNLIGDDTGCSFPAMAGDQVGTGAAPLDPRLGPLADNGGATPTHALGPGSPAIDAGNPAVPGSGGTACAAADQRGVTRNCDVGAYELVFCAKVIVNRIGTEERDVLVGTSGTDGFLALGGNDTARGRGQKDAACMGSGKDAASGGGGSDVLRGEKGNDRLRGQGGRDRLKGGPGKDTCGGGTGRDRGGSCEKRRAIP